MSYLRTVVSFDAAVFLLDLDLLSHNKYRDYVLDIWRKN